jgi:hypothetical protein
MGSTGLIILLVAVSFFVVVGLTATSNLVDNAKLSNDSSITHAVSGASGVMSPLWMVFVCGILIIGAYSVIHAYSNM